MAPRILPAGQPLILTADDDPLLAGWEQVGQITYSNDVSVTIVAIETIVAKDKKSKTGRSRPKSIYDDDPFMWVQVDVSGFGQELLSFHLKQEVDRRSLTGLERWLLDMARSDGDHENISDIRAWPNVGDEGFVEFEGHRRLGFAAAMLKYPRTFLDELANVAPQLVDRAEAALNCAISAGAYVREAELKQALVLKNREELKVRRESIGAASKRLTNGLMRFIACLSG
jgi:hypothetical protein